MPLDQDLGNGLLDVLDTGVTEQVILDSNLSESQIGSQAQILLLYPTRRSYCDCCSVWEDKKPDDDEDPELKQRLEKARDQYAILKRLKRHGHGQWEIHSIVINSKHVRNRLFDVFQDYSNLDVHAEKLVFSPPFLPFVHRWQELMQAQDKETDEVARSHMKLLTDVLGTATENSFKTLEHIRRTGFVTFTDLELVYMCGEVVLQTQDLGAWSAGILRDIDKGCLGNQKLYAFKVDVVDWNGEVFGVREQCWTILEYKGSRSLEELQVMPLRVHPDPEGVQDLLIARGRQFESLKGQHLQQYGGRAAVVSGTSPRTGRFTPGVETSERVIVDAQTFYALQNKPRPALRPLQELSQASRKKQAGHRYRTDSYKRLPSEDSSVGLPYEAEVQSKWSLAGMVSKLATGHSQQAKEGGPESDELAGLSNEACFLCVAYVRGFRIEAKKWCELQVSNLRDVEWNDGALDNLVLGRAEKKLIMALLSSKPSNGQQTFDDFIQGKGKGVIFLLGGPPGVGKTLTAESVAENLHRPLYRLGASDLGSSTESLETGLGEALIRCAAWNAILLIDEADVFLECRKPGDLDRNELVSVFLRLLEYYSGILFLTTNRVETLDPAFESRIDMAFHYPELNAASRATVFRNLLAMLPADSVEPLSDDDVTGLMSEPINGRHIKSAVKTACILAQSDSSKISKEHFREVLEIRRKTKAFLSTDS